MSNLFDKEFFQTVISLPIEEIENSIKLSRDTTSKVSLKEHNLLIFGFE